MPEDEQTRRKPSDCYMSLATGREWQIEVKPHEVAAGSQGQRLWDPLESTCRHASLSIL